ncbi:copper chaperone PCu(A)C [Arenimonas sp.]|jgi:copper(I)-binding protein|uniref:copper chaperone PCu(A)C n=1 Tax=Arenimonas sp. TaxID=1872635 RepID=UPI0037C08757
MRLHFLGSLLLTLVLVTGAQASDSLVFNNAWVRATPPNAKVAGGFVQIRNSGKTSDRLVSASSEAAERVEIHEMKMVGDVMQMRQLTEGLVIPAGQSVQLKPGSYHLMLMAPKKSIAEGQKVSITLVFEKAGKRAVEFTAAKQPPVAAAETAHNH